MCVSFFFSFGGKSFFHINLGDFFLVELDDADLKVKCIVLMKIRRRKLKKLGILKMFWNFTIFFVFLHFIQFN